MEKLIVRQSEALHGTVRISGAKNAVLPILAACLLTEEPCTITNVPALTDVMEMAELLEEFVAETLGVSRQAVSKWESGASAPGTTNLMAFAKVFDVSAEELLKETQKN